jgi:hypothetical protein
MTTSKEIKITRPLVFEDTYDFNKIILLPKCLALAQEPHFNSKKEPLMMGSAGTSAKADLINGINNISRDPDQPHLWPELNHFVSWVRNKARGIFDEWRFEYSDIEITKSWINRHQQGGWTNAHYHLYSDLVVSAYIQAPLGSGNLVITDPMEYHWMGYRAAVNTDILLGNIIPVEDNTVVFFAPFLRHHTEINQTQQDRWVLSLNLRTLPLPRNN